MRYIGIKLDSTPIQMEPVTIRQYNNLLEMFCVDNPQKENKKNED